ncbi:thiamine pyrophosphate-binding protein [Micromonospora sp. WMMD987]|uniref:thiamine pyrophosphate-binding protein n=1 Tax=Micromonospora TaxID=1873 RepID=UPI00249A869A|nr:thiamine pyrophosphate-binding protein [Micromonospora sp. WMMD987]WFE97405.1 thiamine pyrophosphate-binding protein [Micromonospora sp. WMMD987]
MAVPDCASALSDALLEREFAPFFGTPCGILAPLYSRLEATANLWTVSREDNAVGVAAGAAMAGRSPVVLMQNSGLGQSVNALASLVVPYRIPMLLIVSLRGVPPDFTTENIVMGRLTEPLLREAGIPTVHLEEENLAAQADWAGRLVVERRQPAALLVPPALLGWQA